MKLVHVPISPRPTKTGEQIVAIVQQTAPTHCQPWVHLDSTYIKEAIGTQKNYLDSTYIKEVIGI